MMKKRINSKTVEAVRTEEVIIKKAEEVEEVDVISVDEFKKGAILKPKVKMAYNFPVGTQFMLEGTVYRVRKAMKEMNTDMRLVQSPNGEEIFTLTTLRNDAVRDSGFMIVD